MTYQATLDFLYAQLPMYQRVGARAMKKDLTNITALATALGEPHQAFPCIHIAGTNGKGSTTHLIAAALQATGLKVGVYTSPHYRDFRERIKINGELISRSAVVNFVEQHLKKQPLQHVDKTPIRASFFEITVALAFDYFRNQEVDIAIIETGLGGRLDSTNIVNPLVSVITNISFDHQQFLGDTLPLIAGEKAGIIKPVIPTIIGETHNDTCFVFREKTRKEGCQISFADQQWKALEKKTSPSLTTYDIYHYKHLLFNDLEVNIAGNYQQKNIQTALATLKQLAKVWDTYSLEKDTLRDAWLNLKSRTYFIGRWQLLAEHPTTICDSAHNAAGLQMVMQQLREIPHDQLHIVIGMVNDKDVEKALQYFPKSATYYFAKPAIPRGLDARILKGKANAMGLKGRSYVSVKNAWKAAKRKATTKDLIYIGGSTFVVAEVV